jgi:hypothetical protein
VRRHGDDRDVFAAVPGLVAEIDAAVSGAIAAIHDRTLAKTG